MEKVKENTMFKELGLEERVLKAIDHMGFTTPSDIQREAIPVLMEDHDLIGQAQTGTGKTLAFGAPMLSKIEKEKGKIKGIILAPTRELAIQVNDELKRIAKYKEIKVTPVYGGSSIDTQIKAIKSNTDVVVGTPGRVLDLIRRRVIKLKDIEYLILDEADEMLNMGFIDDIEEIVSNCNEDRQTLLFSATMPDRIKSLAKNYMKSDVKHVKIAKKSVTTTSVEQFYFETRAQHKLESLCRILDYYSPTSAIIFCNTKKEVDNIVVDLQRKGYNVEGMHGDMTQSFRMRTLENFRNGNIKILVATDVAARGIDVSDITHVINYGLPFETESYVHRIGRTGRANKTGISYTIITNKDRFRLKQIEKTLRCTINKLNVPKVNEIFGVKINSITENIETKIEEKDYVEFAESAKSLLEKYNEIDIISALLKIKYKEEVTYEMDDSKLEESNNRQSNRQGGRQNQSTKNGELRLFINIGRKDNVSKGKLVKLVSEESKIKENLIQKVTVLDKFSFFNIDEKNLNKVMDGCQGLRFCGRKINIEVANKK